MAVLVWKHGTSKAEARSAIQSELRQLGYEGRVAWDGDRATARVGPFGTILNVSGTITDDLIVLEKCGGLAGGTVLKRSRELLERLYPGGEQAN